MSEEQKNNHNTGAVKESGSGFSAIFIRRPVTTLMLTLVLLVLGIMGYNSMGVDLYPNVEMPFVLVQTALPGASPEEMETSVSKIIEESVNTISGIDYMMSYSFEGASIVGISFILEKDADVATQEVRDKVNLVLSQLPDGTEAPVISKIQMDALPVLTITVSGDRDIVELTELARKRIKENIENVDGVGSVTLRGGREREVHVVVNPFKMASLGIPINSVKTALSEQNIEIPGGRVEQDHSEYTLRVLGRVATVSDFANIFVANINGAPIKIADIGYVEDSGEYERASTWLNGRRTVSMEVKKQSGTNTLKTIEGIKARLDTISSVLPSDISINLLMDQSGNIRSSVNTVLEHLVLGAIFASLCVFVFMGSLKSTIIAALAIPVSIIGSFFFMQGSGFTLNNMTLLGLTVAVGIVIDDAIVMLENIFRHMEEYGKPPLQAAYDGAREITGAIVATTASILVIFLPLAYMSGIVGRFVRSYGLTVVFAIFLSGVVALTLTPMMCSKLLKPEKKHSKLENFVTKVNGKFVEWYLPMLEWALRHRVFMVVVSVLLIFSMTGLPYPKYSFSQKKITAGYLPGMLAVVKSDFLPKDDSGKFQISLEAPEGTSYEDSLKLARQVVADVEKLPHVKDIFSGIGLASNSFIASNAVNTSYVIVEMDDTPARKKITTQQYVDAAREMLQKYDGVKSTIDIVSDSPSSGNAELQFVLTGPDIDQLAVYGNGMIEYIKKHEPGIIDLDLSLSLAKPEYRIVINRAKAQDLGVKVNDIATALRTMVGGEEDITKYKEGDELYEVRLRVEAEYRSTKESIASLLIPAGSGKVVRVDSVATIEEGFGPTQIERYDRQRQVTVSGNLSGIDMGTGTKKIQEAFDAQKPSPEYRGELRGMAKEMGKMLMSFLMAFFLAFLFKYMILAAQFENMAHPIAILTSLPITLPFAVFSLWVTGESLNIFSLLGLFMLIGIVSKNSILQTDYTNTLRHEHGLPRLDAILEANKVRLRPILMTTITLVAGVMPIVFGTGTGAASRRSLGIVVAGGQTLSLLITLLMTPVTYTLVDDLGEWIQRRFLKKKGSGEGQSSEQAASPDAAS